MNPLQQLTSPHDEGIFPDYPEQSYRLSPGINQSSLKAMRLSPKHYLAELLKPYQEPTPAQKTGTLLHALVLCNQRRFTTIPDDAPKRPTQAQLNAEKPSKEAQESIKYWSRLTSANPGKELLHKDDAKELEDMAASILENPFAKEILDRQGKNEVAAWRRCKETGLLLKGRADRITCDDANFVTIPDLKTTQEGCAQKKEFEKEILNWDYFIQAPFYIDLFQATHFLFIVVEKVPPYACSVFPMQPAVVAYGRKVYREWIRKIKWCLDNQKWPAYEQDMQPVGLPPFIKID